MRNTSRSRFASIRKKNLVVLLLLLTIVATTAYLLIYNLELEEIDKSESNQVSNPRSTQVKSEDGEEIREYFTRMAFFWSGDDLKNFFFKGFNVNSQEGLAGVCIGLASSAILFEGLRNLRDFYMKKFIDNRRSQRILNFKRKSSARVKQGRNNKSLIPGPSNEVAGGGGGDMGDASTSLMRSPEEDDDDYELNPRSGNNFSKTIIGKACHKDKCKHFSFLFVSTLIHVIYILIGYILMLAVMTFNVWILVAIGIGVGIGQFIFGVFKRTEIILTDDKDIISTSRNNDGDGISPSATATTELGVPGVNNARTQPFVAPDLLDVRNDGRYSSAPSSASDNSNRGKLTTEIIVHPPATASRNSP